LKNIREDRMVNKSKEMLGRDKMKIRNGIWTLIIDCDRAVI